MKLLILCPRWGMEDLPLETFLEKIKKAGFDGVDSWVPESRSERSNMRSLLESYELKMVSHQHQANGNDCEAFCKSFTHYLEISAETNPVLINSHSGRDWFSLKDNLKVLDTAAEFESSSGIPVVHETHRGRLAFSPGHAKYLFDQRPAMRITADLSHWVCVTESYLENFGDIVSEAITRTAHIHARVGFPEGPQVPDPRLPQWKEALDYFRNLWLRILREQRQKGTETFTVTTECGPPPYMWTLSENNKPVASQWEINLFIKDLLRKLELECAA